MLLWWARTGADSSGDTGVTTTLYLLADSVARMSCSWDSEGKMDGGFNVYGMLLHLKIKRKGGQK